eukprot:1911663-Pleurochrysis_carterae.AAC.1
MHTHPPPPLLSRPRTCTPSSECAKARSGNAPVGTRTACGGARDARAAKRPLRVGKDCRAIAA